MSLEKHIHDLLYRYQCVVVTGFGAFLSKHKAAEVVNNTFYPPCKVLSFNAQLVGDDGLLAKHIATCENVSYEKAVYLIAQQVATWKTHLQQDKTLCLAFLGDFCLGTEQNIIFKPKSKQNYLTSSFGLDTFTCIDIVRDTTKHTQKTKTTLPKRNKAVLLKYAAIATGVILTSSVFYSVYQKNTSKTLAAIERQKQFKNNIQEATFLEANPLELPAITLEKISTKPYYIIAGAFRDHTNALAKAKQLQEQGFKANVLEQNTNGLYQVYYQRFYQEQKATHFLKEIKQHHNNNAWLLVQ